MRLSPPISVLTILTAAFVWMGVYQGPLGCSVDSTWEVGSSSLVRFTDCNPWQREKPTMPITQIRIGPMVQYWVLLVRRDGTGYFAIERPGHCGPPPGLGCDIPEPLPTDLAELRKSFVVHDFKDPQIYGRLYSQLSPLRDFLGDMSILDFARERHMRSSPRRAYGCDRKHLSSTDAFWIDWGGGPDNSDSVSLMNFSCNTRATNAAGKRIRLAVEEVARLANVPPASLLKEAGLESF